MSLVPTMIVVPFCAAGRAAATERGGTVAVVSMGEWDGGA